MEKSRLHTTALQNLGGHESENHGTATKMFAPWRSHDLGRRRDTRLARGVEGRYLTANAENNDQQNYTNGGGGRGRRIFTRNDD